METLSGTRSATDDEPEDRKGKRKNNKQLGGDEGRRHDGRFERGPNKNATKTTDVKLYNAVLKALCVLSQQAREVRGAKNTCWVIKQEAPEYKKPKEQLRAYSEQAAFKGKGLALGPP